MPPKPARGSRGGASGGRGAAAQTPPRGTGAVRGGGRGGAAGGATSTTLPPASSAAQAIGVMRQSYGIAGKAIKVKVNALTMNTPELTMYQFDAMEKNFRPKFNMQLITQMQADNATIFRSSAIFDGRKNLYTIEDLKFSNNSRSFDVIFETKVYKIKLTQTRVVDTTTLLRYISRRQSWDENVATALAALNIAIRMKPSQTHPFRVRSFYTTNGTNVGQGLQAVRGYFQSIRPVLNRLIINVDISTGIQYKPGPLIALCLDHLGVDPQKPQSMDYLNARKLNDAQRLRLQRFLSGLTVEAKTSSGRVQFYSIAKLTKTGAKDIRFEQDGKSLTVEDYFRKSGDRLRFSDMICIETKRGAVIPLERCTVPPGQLTRMELLPDTQRKVVEFATQKPFDRLNEIRRGMSLFAYGQSEYVRAFGLKVDETSLPQTIPARILPPPPMQYAVGNKIDSVAPAFGSWNMAGKRFMRPADVPGWMMVVFVPQHSFRQEDAQRVQSDFANNAKTVGMKVDSKVTVSYANAQGNIIDDIKQAGSAYKTAHNGFPGFVLCILPDRNNTEIYRTIKHWGDMMAGVATQCVLAGKASRAKAQYWANVMLKVNVKLGGIDTYAVSNALSDPAHPTLVMGADVMHPAPGSDAPSYAAVVGSIDSKQSKYISRTRVQISRQEMIADLHSMSKEILENYVGYQRTVEKKAQPKLDRLIFFRDGVSEGEFKKVLEEELPALKQASMDAKLAPKITFIIVGKRHHIRFFPNTEGEGDRSGNVPAGTVVDSDITNPLEHDFYLVSHGGLLGTSRGSHYTIVHDETQFSPDQIQIMAYTLCHTYARATRSVSIPAPVYYAHIVCSRAKTHYIPKASAPSVISGGTSKSADKATMLEAHKKEYKEVHKGQQNRMYFM